jgi:hypothetical protein
VAPNPQTTGTCQRAGPPLLAQRTSLRSPRSRATRAESKNQSVGLIDDRQRWSTPSSWLTEERTHLVCEFLGSVEVHVVAGVGDRCPVTVG